MLSINLRKASQSLYSEANFNAATKENLRSTNDFKYSSASSMAFKAYALGGISFGNNKEVNLPNVLKNFQTLLQNSQMKNQVISIKMGVDPGYEMQIRSAYGSPTEPNSKPDNDVAIVVNPDKHYAILGTNNSGQVELKSFATLGENEDHPVKPYNEDTTEAQIKITKALKLFENGQYNSIEGFMGVFIDHGVKPTDITKEAIYKILDRIKTVYSDDTGNKISYQPKDLPYDGLKLVLNDGRILHIRQTICPQPEKSSTSGENYVQLTVYPHLGSRKPDFSSVLYVNPEDQARFGTIVQAGLSNGNMNKLIDRAEALPQLEKVFNEVYETKYLSPIIGIKDLSTIDYEHFNVLKQLFNQIRTEPGKFEESERKSIELNLSGIIAGFNKVKVAWPGDNDSLRYHEAPSSRLELEFISNAKKPNVNLTINTAGQIIKSSVGKKYSEDLVNRFLTEMPKISEVG